MSADDPRAEVAAVARSLRRALERERPNSELLAHSATVARRRDGKGGATRRTQDTTTKPTVTESAPPAASTPVSPAAASPGPSKDLFGAPLAVAPPPRPSIEVVDDPVQLPSHHAALNPIDPAERRAIDAAARPVLEQIALEARACRACGLCETRTQAVPGVGSALSGIVFVGEAPGAEEDRRGEPFVGRAGELLTKIIKAMDEARLIPDVTLSRETVYIHNVLKCRPPENRNPLPHEIESCSPYLHRQLEVLKPRIICCLGKFAAELLVGAKGTIAGLRGKVYRHHGAKLIVTYHPAACLRNPNYKRPVWEDMQTLAREYLT